MIRVRLEIILNIEIRSWKDKLFCIECERKVIDFG